MAGDLRCTPTGTRVEEKRQTSSKTNYENAPKHLNDNNLAATDPVLFNKSPFCYGMASTSAIRCFNKELSVEPYRKAFTQPMRHSGRQLVAPIIPQKLTFVLKQSAL